MSNVPFVCRVAIDRVYVEPKYTVERVDFKHEANAHQGVIITTTVPIAGFVWKTGTPVTVEYGQPPYDFSTFYGYINHIEYITTNRAELWCVGASFVLKNEHLKVWNNVSPSYIAKQMAIDSNMGAVVDTYSSKVTMVQSGESDLTFLSRLADHIGFRFFVVNTTLYFINPLLPIRKVVEVVPWFWVTPKNFQPRIGENVPGQGNPANIVSYAMDPSSNRLVTLKAQYDEFQAFGSSSSFAPTLNKYSIYPGVNSQKELLNRLNAEVSANLHWVTAALQLTSGSVKLRPYSVIELRGDVDKRFTGYWLVETVQQSLIRNGPNAWIYNSNLSILRDQIYGIQTRPLITQAGATELNKTIWRKGMWVASRVGV